MHNELNAILKRIDSRHLSKLWGFYRNYFVDDSSCLYFIYNCLKSEPENNGLTYRESKDQPGVFVAENGDTINDNVFIPRRMLNAVERLVSAARDMDQIRRGKDVFKIVFLVTCVETLQQLSGKNASKKDLLFSFFRDFTSEEDKCYIAKRFRRDDEDAVNTNEDSFQQFVGVINEYRNCAAHEGDYWDYCFNNNAERDEWPALLVVKIDLERYSIKGKKEHCFLTQISYKEFEEIFIRTCISFVQSYIGGMNHANP